jgi:hypothetical protein
MNASHLIKWQGSQTKWRWNGCHLSVQLCIYFFGFLCIWQGEMFEEWWVTVSSTPLFDICGITISEMGLKPECSECVQPSKITFLTQEYLFYIHTIRAIFLAVWNIMPYWHTVFLKKMFQKIMLKMTNK